MRKVELRAIEKPADLVGWSYGGPIVLRAAAEVPDKVHRIVLYEPYVPEMLGGTPEAEAAAESFWGLWGATEEALEAGDETKALEASIEAANGLPIGGFAAQAPAVQTMQLENKHTVRLNWDAPEPKAVTCEELSLVRAQTLVITGSRTLPAYTEIGKAVAACVPGATIAVLEGSGHEAPVAGAPDLPSRYDAGFYRSAINSARPDVRGSRFWPSALLLLASPRGHITRIMPRISGLAPAPDRLQPRPEQNRYNHRSWGIRKPVFHICALSV